MGTGYVRQSSADIVTGAVVEAAPLNLEFNALRDAFHETSGHSHDGTVGEGPKIDLTTSASGVLPVARGGFAAIHKINGTAAPTSADDSDDGYGPGSMWVDTTNDRIYFCVDATVAAAVWVYAGNSSGWQPLDATLTALAGVTTAADKLIYATGSDTFTTTDFSAFGRTLVDDADASALLTTLGITSSVAELNYTDGVTSAIQTQLDAKQTLDADLTALAALSGTNTIYYRSAANTWTAVTIGGNLTFTGGTLDAVASSLDATLTAMGGVVTAADTGIYFTGVDVAASYTLTSFARTLLDDATAGAALTTLGVSAFAQTILDDADAATVRTTIGAQASDATLTALAAYNTNGLVTQTAADTFTGRTLTGPAAGITVTNGDGVSGNPTLALANDLAALEALAGTDTLYYRSGSDTWTAVTIGSGITFSGGTLSATSSGGTTIMTPVATTSGTGTTGKSFSIPSGAKKITLTLSGVSGSGTGYYYIRLGDAGGVENTGYLNKGTNFNSATVESVAADTTFHPVMSTVAGIGAGTAVHGSVELTLINSATFNWAISAHTFTSGTGTIHFIDFGTKALSQELSTVTLYLSSGNFDAGEIGCVYTI